MRVSYKYEPEMARFWLGAEDGKNFKQYALQSWMDVEDVIEILRQAQKDIERLT